MVWLCFLCSATRAIHIECVNSLEAAAFLCALSKFIARCGKSEKIYSDNGTNFRGAQEELQNAVTSLDSPAGSYALDLLEAFMRHCLV